MMRLGVAYNLFDGEELLEYSVRSLREHVSHIVVVYQEVSNFGDICSPDLRRLLTELHRRALVDDFVKYDPVLELGARLNELAKRNLGLRRCVEKACSHFMSLDTDEFYLGEELAAAKLEILEGEHDSSFCRYVTYYKEPYYRLDPKDEYYVPLIYRARDGVECDINQEVPVPADPTRRMAPGKSRIFHETEIEMHHMSYVRRDIRKKLENSSGREHFIGEIDRLVEAHENFSYGGRALLPGRPTQLRNVVKVDGPFDFQI
jgi:hypothetical protein